MENKYSAYIYDWDGCLLNSLPTWVDTYKNILLTAGIKSSSTEIIKVLGNKDALESLGHPNVEMAKLEFSEALNKNIVNARLYANAIKSLGQIRNRGIRIFLATSSPKLTVENSPEYKKVSMFIEHSVFADDVIHYKPNPQSINIILKKFNIPTNEALMIGDSDKDILAARNAGIDSVLFAPQENKPIHDFKYLYSLNPTWKTQGHAEIANLN